METIYKSAATRERLMELYETKLKSFKVPYAETDFETPFGKTHAILMGDKNLPPIIAFHGINAGSPVTLEALQGLCERYLVIGLDTPGQATRSTERRLDMKTNEYGKWAASCMDALSISKAPVIGVSFGSFILQRLLVYDHKRVEKAFFVVPSGFVNGDFWPTFKRVSLPLMKFLISKKEADLRKFMSAFYLDQDEYSVEMQKNVLLGVKVDYRRPLLLSEKETAQINTPVYIMVADDDVFFPGQAALSRAKHLFSRFRESYLLKGARHIPDKSQYAEMCGIIDRWLLTEEKDI